MERTDIHRPSVIVPADYRFVGFEYLKAEPGEMLVHREVINAYRAAHPGVTYSRHAHGGTCHICGAAAIYTALFHHLPSNVFIRTGLECCDKLDSSVDGREFRKTAERAREARAGKRKAEAVLAAAGLPKAWEVTEFVRTWEVGAGDEIHYEERTIADIVGKLVKYGSVSDKALNYVRVLLEKIEKRAGLAAAREAEREAAAPVPTGRVHLSGEVLTTKRVETRFGMVTKMLVRGAAGWKVYGTKPAAIEVARGCWVEFTATVEASKDDPKFGFFSRPTGARVRLPVLELPPA